MATQYTTNLLMPNPEPGDPAVKNAWGTIENTGRTLADSAVAGTLDLSVAGSSNVILTSLAGAPDQSRNAHYILTGVLTGNITVFWPQGLGRMFSVSNQTTGNFTLTIAVNNGSGSPAGTTYAVPQGNVAILSSDGTDIALRITLAAILGTISGSSGIVAIKTDGTATVRTLTGTANEIAVANGTGNAGDPTFSLPSALTFTGKTITGGTYGTMSIVTAVVSYGGMGWLDADASNVLIPTVGSNLTSTRTLTFTTGDASRTLTITGDPTLVAGTMLAAGNNLSDLTSAATARTNLGLGTAAVVNTGTSGATIPLLNANLTFSGNISFTGTVTGPETTQTQVSYSADHTLQLTDGGKQILLSGNHTLTLAQNASIALPAGTRIVIYPANWTLLWGAAVTVNGLTNTTQDLSPNSLAQMWELFQHSTDNWVLTTWGSTP